ncbi:MAG: hypothetical protein AAFY31_10735, partial [Pseudomonadota bacterium]
RVSSEIELPECGPEIEGSGRMEPADIRIFHDAFPFSVSGMAPFGPYMDRSPRACLFKVPAVARYLIEDGRTIRVDRDPSDSELELRAYLLGTALGVALHQRGLVPLHVSVVESPAGLVAFSGPSGAGKSTIAAALHLQRGWPILTDDLAVLTGDPGEVRLSFGVRRLRLWEDAIVKLDLDNRPRTKVIDRVDKFQFDLVPITPEDVTLGAVFLLLEGDLTEIVPIRGQQALTALRNCIYRPDFFAAFNDQGSWFQTLASAADRLEINALIRPMAEGSLERTAQLLVEWADDRNGSDPAV